MRERGNEDARGDGCGGEGASERGTEELRGE